MLKNLFTSVKQNISELYTGIVLVVFIPLVVGFLTDLLWGLLLSFAVQATIGILYIRKDK